MERIITRVLALKYSPHIICTRTNVENGRDENRAFPRSWMKIFARGELHPRMHLRHALTYVRTLVCINPPAAGVVNKGCIDFGLKPATARNSAVLRVLDGAHTSRT